MLHVRVAEFGYSRPFFLYRLQPHLKDYQLNQCFTANFIIYFSYVITQMARLFANNINSDLTGRPNPEWSIQLRFSLWPYYFYHNNENSQLPVP